MTVWGNTAAPNARHHPTPATVAINAAAAADSATAASIALATSAAINTVLVSVEAIALMDPKIAKFIAELDEEEFWSWISHSDNASHLKSSGNWHWWSNQQDTLGFIRSILVSYGCPGKGKGAWDGLGAMAKTKLRRDITNEKCRTPSGRIRNALWKQRSTFELFLAMGPGWPSIRT